MDRREALSVGAVVLGAAAAAPLLAACTDGSSGGGPAPTPSPSGSAAGPTPRAAAAEVESALVDLTARILELHPSLATRVQPIHDAHVAHLAALGGAPTPSASPSAHSGGFPPGPKASDAVHRLALAERGAAGEHAAGARAAEPADARLIASLAAYSAAQAALLTGGAA